MNIFWIVLILIFAAADPAWAHDCWIQPNHFKLGLDSILIIRLLVGHQMKTDKELALEKKMTPRLTLQTRTGTKNLIPMSEEGSLPLLSLKPEFTGTGLVAMDRDFTDIVLENDKFTSYISGEHHSQWTDRVNANPRGKQKEEYARCVKTLVHVGEDPPCPEVASLETGQRLEILLLSSPWQAEPVRVKVLFDGKPLAEKTVTAFVSNDSMVSQTAVTTENGEAKFQYMGPGMWLVRLIHLFPCEDDRDMDWTSYWGAFCFETASPESSC